MNVDAEGLSLYLSTLMLLLVPTMDLAIELSLAIFGILFLANVLLILKVHHPYLAVPIHKKILTPFFKTAGLFILFFTYMITFASGKTKNDPTKLSWPGAKSWLDQQNVPPPEGFKSWIDFFLFKPHILLFFFAVLGIFIIIILLPEIIVQTGMVKAPKLRRIRQLHDFYDDFVPDFNRFWRLWSEKVLSVSEGPAPEQWFKLLEDPICLPSDLFERLPFLSDWSFIEVMGGKLRFVSIDVVTTKRIGILSFQNHYDLLPTFLRDPTALTVGIVSFPIPKDMIRHLEGHGAVDFEDFDNMGSHVSLFLRLEDKSPNRPLLEGLKSFWQAHEREYLEEVERLKAELRQELQEPLNLGWRNPIRRLRRKHELKVKKNLLNELEREFSDNV